MLCCEQNEQFQYGRESEFFAGDERGQVYFPNIEQRKSQSDY